MHEALGEEVFRSSLSSILDKWVLSLFVGCVPPRLLEYLWIHLLLPSPLHPSSLDRRLPRGLSYLAAFTLAALDCCGEARLRGGTELQQLQEMRGRGMPA